MELTEPIDSLNRQLIDLFGIDTITGHPIWRIVFSENQFEKRLVDTTDEGLVLLHPVVREVPKYRQWIKEKYVLERLVLVPDVNREELGGVKQSYEPLFVFEDGKGDYLPPKIQVAKFVIDSVYAAQGKTSLAKYKEPSGEESLEIKSKQVDQLVEDIYGDETDVTDHLRRKTGIIVPHNFNDSNKES
jgi:hypothetical protein